MGADRGVAAPDPAAPYERLCALAERELELIGDGRWDELRKLHRTRTALIATLPATPPASAREPLERCALLQRRVEIELLRCRDGLLHTAGELQRARRAARGYAPARTRRPGISASA